MAMYKTFEIAKILPNLPDGVIPHTFSWVRYYQKEDLLAKLVPIFESIQCRYSLVAMLNVFQVGLRNFLTRLAETKHVQDLPTKKLEECLKTDRPRLNWAYKRARMCDVCDPEAINRLPVTFSRIDNARRLRNDIVHNHGLFTDRYETDALHFDDAEVILHPDYALFKDRRQSVPIKLATSHIEDFSRSHIEVLHVLHNEIQKDCFGHSDPDDPAYDYRRAEKRIEWDRAFSGA
jgi:hypothetical protein